MSDEALNMSMRRFLKQVGVTSQQEIEAAVRAAGGLEEPVAVRMVLTIDALGLTHTIDGKIGPETGS